MGIIIWWQDRELAHALSQTLIEPINLRCNKKLFERGDSGTESTRSLLQSSASTSRRRRCQDRRLTKLYGLIIGIIATVNKLY